jgi:nuclear transport factor 2 (NTF2) superfamily protein
MMEGSILDLSACPHGLMRLRIASINDLPIGEGGRKYHWPLGRRPDDHQHCQSSGFKVVFRARRFR